MFFVPVGGEAAEVEVDFPAGDKIKRSGSEDRTKHLGADVSREIAGGESFTDHEVNGNGRVSVAAGNMANGGRQHGVPAFPEHQPKRADRFCSQSIHRRFSQ